MSLPRGFFRTPPQVLSSSASGAKHLIRPAVPSQHPASAHVANSSVTASVPLALALSKPAQPLATVPAPFAPPPSPHDPSPIWFDSAATARFSANGGKPEDERRVKLGRTLRVLHDRLPSLLQSPLPQELLAPNISLHLFPSTHPYLPAVSGRVGYIAALWTSPIAWNRVPIIGNLKLEILSERMTTQPLYYSPRRTGAYDEQLVVKWRTADNNKNNGSSTSLAQRGEHNLDHALRGTLSPGSKKEFTGLFIFEFDSEGRIISHTIEHVDQNSEWEKGVGAKVVHLADWLLGGIKGRPPQGACPMFLKVRRDRRDPRDPRLR
ncbi:hypothetical protein PG993_008150 [Apiospora rasikravindrae]|uniref:Chromosome transmission fidelity protein 4 n=1 Tax=Apiospora rasikravindrae TaxID=990691 RepID=A0ABR1T1D0_9PEZI